ncbi:fat storage-inducing transmembrane protein 2 [Electrophorus electricus]|uniref:Fat storage-inducing transmembrane protein 2 n=1 Tax=Electrophorus electricus TaxID=8005 RepID=A0A4W4HQ05_ELEEL|nr:fat storage-inducing transmembrane protein 2 [Electrophorus electricus]
MAVLNSVVDKLVSFWTLKFIRKYLKWFFLCVSFTGSLLKELDVVPKTYFSNRRNIFNLYFVKISWSWNLVLLLPFIFLSNSYNRNLTFVLKRLLSLVVATAIWYLCTESFFYIEDITGECYESESVRVVLGKFNTKAECRKAGFLWNGFDISGHSFILAYSTLIIVEEMDSMLYLVQQRRTAFLDVLYVALNAIVVLWIWMFGCTSVYFHDTIHKVLGTLFGILGWYVSYKVWYPKPFSPGLPPLPSEQKYH